ncbi:hypothetical protein UFOVP1537_18 [uncultured Caudovirales phage]|uniref:Uncharacterized protein n=2 Tax=root TaxID=1 RepID=A0A6J5PMN9_9CAUD|nr:hypothetical protein UFOVP825_36 [uncultured Caudovirales phage]CAB4171216.1 hypothetical protein UFOVP915_18 [uncultured Caudovirales phage]CAB4177218.1 hypothetical protein UFOVP1000_35 [uncultured Caudovirales phage]CAB4182592.1 hypothetical protein UFOVP1092_10 [uncultured Caudovirales phage]CAB4187391.1 hypothetical protein UFOVP1152_14 [uncultured Caudovirales phage]
MPLPKHLADKLGVHGVIALRTMPKDEATIVETFKHTITGAEDIISLMEFAGGISDAIPKDAVSLVYYEEENKAVQQRLRRLYFASAWVAGVSWRALGRQFSIQGPTVAQGANKHLPSNVSEREAMRLDANISTTRQESMLAIFRSNYDQVKHMTVVDIASWMLAETRDVDEND